MQVCAITGYRPSRFPFKNDETDIMCKRLKKKITKELKYLYKKGVHTFWIGGAEGVDMWSSEILMQLKRYDAYSDIKIMIALPFENHDKKWTKEHSERLQNIITNADETIIVSSNDKPTRELYRERNKYIVDKADCLLAIFNKEKIFIRSGTHMTITFALKKGIPITIIDSSKLI